MFRLNLGFYIVMFLGCLAMSFFVEIDFMVYFHGEMLRSYLVYLCISYKTMDMYASQLGFIYLNIISTLLKKCHDLVLYAYVLVAQIKMEIYASRFGPHFI